MSAVAALSVVDQISQTASRANCLLKGVDAKLLVTREQFQNASVEKRGTKNDAAVGTFQLAKVLLRQFDALAVIESGTCLTASEVYDILDTLASQQQLAALNVQFLVRLRKAAHECNTQAAQTAFSWASSHEDAICKIWPGAFERLAAAGSRHSPDSGLESLSSLLRSFATMLSLRAAEGLISSLLASLGYAETDQSQSDVGPLATLLPRWLSLSVNSSECIQDVSGLSLALLSGGSETPSICERWKLLGERIRTQMVSHQQLQDYLDMLGMESSLAIWLFGVSKNSRWTLSEKLLVASEGYLSSELSPHAENSSSMLERATNELCSALYALFGPCAALWPLAPQVAGFEVGQESMVYDIILKQPSVLAVLRGPCANLYASLESLSAAAAASAWQTMRSAVQPHSTCGHGLLPADLLAMLFVCHVVCMKGSEHDSAADCGLVIASNAVTNVTVALLKEALCDVPFAQPSSLQSGFEAFLGLSWPPRSSFEQISGLRSPPSRFPGIIGAWSQYRIAVEQPDAWSLQAFLTALDRLK